MTRRAVTTVAGLVVLVGIAAGAFLIGRSGRESHAGPGTTSTASPSVTTTPPASTVTTPPASAVTDTTATPTASSALGGCHPGDGGGSWTCSRNHWRALCASSERGVFSVSVYDISNGAELVTDIGVVFFGGLGDQTGSGDVPLADAGITPGTYLAQGQGLSWSNLYQGDHITTDNEVSVTGSIGDYCQVVHVAETST